MQLVKNRKSGWRNHGKEKLTDHEVDLLRHLAEKGMPQKVLAEKFEISKGHVSKLLAYKAR